MSQFLYSISDKPDIEWTPDLYRDSGINIIGFVPWGTHFCVFYKTKDDLADMLIRYFAAGLKNDEFCMCIASEPLKADDMIERMRAAIPGFDEYLKKGQIKVIPYTEWYLVDGVFDDRRVLKGWVDKLNAILAMGYSGLRLSGNAFWLENPLWKSFMDYEREINETIGQYRIIALCTYPVDSCGASEIIDVANVHQFSMVRKEGEWKLIENVDLGETKKALKDALARAEMYLDLMCHDINNLNQVAMNSLEILLEAMKRDGMLRLEYKKIAEIALNSLKDSTQLIDNVQALQKVRECNVKAEPIDLNAILLRLKEEFLEPTRKNVSISFRPAPNSIVIANSLVKEMLSNLVGNAIKHSDPHRPLNVNVYVEHITENCSSFYKCVVEDDGPGIPDELKKRLFIRFQRGSMRPGGKGLGLYLVRTLAEGFGGRAWVEDRVPGDYTKGSRFAFTLPAMDIQLWKEMEKPGP
ncbi:MEDS domain-containing protein [Methanocella conradii]|uniref:MEDS domain-containing protein n=1 Tax=Methanocella conradii TaxID=1175444 RepID=UPI0024B3BC93|nr:MEDS domain-containing protein [Methanocella conradii]MDI6896487.1 MEDS domain-containing protein [Methanocella conradii]